MPHIYMPLLLKSYEFALQQFAVVLGPFAEQYGRLPLPCTLKDYEVFPDFLASS